MLTARGRYMVGISIGSTWYRRPPGCFACGSIIIQPRLKHSIKESLVATHFAQSTAICAVLWATTFIVAGNSANAQQICQTNVGYCSMRSYDQPGHFCRCPYLNGYANVDGVIYNSGSQALLFPRPRSPQQLYPYQQSYQQPDHQTYPRPYRQPYQQNYEQPDQQFYQRPYEQPYQQSYQQPDQQIYPRPYQQPYQQNYEQPNQRFYQQPHQQSHQQLHKRTYKRSHQQPDQQLN